jgi:hypothetical protein
MNCQHEPNQSNSDYFDQFKTTVEVLESYNANISENIDILVPECADISDNDKVKAARDYILTMAFLIQSDPGCYSNLLSDLHNQYSRGTDQLPRDLTGAYSMLNLYCPPIHVRTISQQVSSSTGSPSSTTPTVTITSSSSIPNNKSDNDTISYLTTSSVVCPVPRPCYTDLFCTQSDQPSGYHVPSTWILLNSQSTHLVFNKDHLVTNIWPSPLPMHAFIKGGHQTSSFVADVPHLGTVCYNPVSVPNILFL